MLDNPFRSPGAWYKANLHAHTTASDGDLPPEECAEFYRRAGYDLLAFTDHWNVVDFPSARPDFLTLPGAEYNVGRAAQGTRYHIVGLNVRARGKLPPRPEVGAQEMIDALRAEGGAAFLAHPYWSGLMASGFLPLQGCFAVEVYNTGCDIEILRGYSMTQWDDLLTLGGSCGGLAVDDGHRHRFDHGRAWTMIRAEELSIPAIMEALGRGRYYASTGPEFLDLQVGEDRVLVTTSPVVSIALVSAPETGGRVQAAEGETLTEAEFPLPQGGYGRVEITDARGRSAWSNPFAGKRKPPGAAMRPAKRNRSPREADSGVCFTNRPTAVYRV